jgi:hypothetical protein
MKRASKTWLRDVIAAAALGAALAAGAWVLHAPRASSGAAANESVVRGSEYLTNLRLRLQQPNTLRSGQLRRADALQAVYLARIESGLGSPFRAIEAALRDPWIPDSIRPLFASAMLAQTLNHGPPAVGRYSLDSAHVAIVDSVVRSHSEPRRGEEIVRVAFDLAATSGAVSKSEAAAATELAAISRDAAYARRDVARLVATAHKNGVSPLDLLPIWRAERRFDVEKPIVYQLGWASSRSLVANAARLFEVLDAQGPAERSDTAADVPRREAVLFDPAVRQGARAVAQDRVAPPSPAIVQATSLLPAGRLQAPTNEEELGALWLSIAALTPGDQRTVARAIGSAAVRLRTSAQDPVWFPSDPAPRVIELQERHGLQAITFPTGLRPAWRDYALIAIDRALTDTRRVFPDLDLRGLRIHVGVKADWPARAMALHDPESRTIYFPLGSAPGVLAHEIGHDLDWQVARSVFGERGIYATDGTARRASPILAAPVERLTGVSASASGGGKSALRYSSNTRPTEVLARHVDWLVAAALATMGRSNGFLTTVQEGGDALGNTTAPQPAHVDAAVSVVTTATRVPVSTVAQVHADADGPPLVRDVVARALATTIRMPWGSSAGGSRRAAAIFDAIGAVPAMFRQSTDPRLARRCMAAAARAAGEPDWVDDVYGLVADARARDVMRRLQQAPPNARRQAASPLRALLAAGPVEPELRSRSAAELRREIEWQLVGAMVLPLAQASGMTCSN